VGQVSQGFRWVGRGIGLDLHCDLVEVAICEDGRVRSGCHVNILHGMLSYTYVTDSDAPAEKPRCSTE
jgi:hypothetical protein